MTDFDSVIQEAGWLRDRLAEAGASDGARAIDGVLHSFWNSTSECLVELLAVLDATRADWDALLSAFEAKRAERLAENAREVLGFR